MPLQSVALPDETLSAGMTVRFPADQERTESDARDYQIGQIVAVDEGAGTLVISLLITLPQHGHKLERRVIPHDTAERCRILPGSSLYHPATERWGQLLVARDSGWEPGSARRYFIQLDGETLCLSEADFLVPSTRQDPHPLQQAWRYELHNPVWRTHRDVVVRSYAALQNATFGIEDLAGSRLHLLPHQAEVIARVLRDEACRYLLADEVGLGKTIEACVILKALRRREPDLKCLIVVPPALLSQWHRELNEKFWLDFVVPTTKPPGSRDPIPPIARFSEPGVLVSTDTLVADEALWRWIKQQPWGLLIADEVHHLHKSERLYERVQSLSRSSERALLLSATPIQQRADEYRALLHLLDPDRYEPLDKMLFERLLGAQDLIRRTVSYISRDLTQERFDAAEFLEEIEPVVGQLDEDDLLKELVAAVDEQRSWRDRGLGAAQEALTYLSENYRIESRVIRNRRRSLGGLPSRELETGYSYVPGAVEEECLQALHDFADRYLAAFGTDRLAVEWVRLLLHAGASSPHALLALLERRVQAAPRTGTPPDVTTPPAPREAGARASQVALHAPWLADEAEERNRLTWYAEGWQRELDEALSPKGGRSFSVGPADPHRLLQVLRALRHAQRDQVKVLLFSSWSETLRLLGGPIEYLFGSDSVARFTTEQKEDDLQEAADQFQSNPRCRFLLTDEIGGEGRNFQIADWLIHIDLPWTPAQLEQRIGRIDRIGRGGRVLSIVPLARESLEEALFDIWQKAFHLFTQSLSGIEIALEEVQERLRGALVRSTRRGMIDLLPTMIRDAEMLRKQVEEEIYYDEQLVDNRARKTFEQTVTLYRDGALLRKALLGWADLAGLSSYSPERDIVVFHPQRFNESSMRNAKLGTLPNMQEALKRSRRTHNLVIQGTFNRDVAVTREELVFFAPGNDPWTDALISNALEADRGRCCAIRRQVADPALTWEGFQFLYSLRVDPRPLFAAGHDPIHLLRAQGILMESVCRVLVDVDGRLVPPRDPLVSEVEPPFDKRRDEHLGQRGGFPSPLARFRERYPPDIWQTVLLRAWEGAEREVAGQLAFMEELADEAAEAFERQARGARAGRRWLQRTGAGPAGGEDLDRFQEISAALVEGIRRPLWRLESLCFWWLSHE